MKTMASGRSAALSGGLIAASIVFGLAGALLVAVWRAPAADQLALEVFENDQIAGQVRAEIASQAADELPSTLLLLGADTAIEALLQTDHGQSLARSVVASRIDHQLGRASGSVELALPALEFGPVIVEPQVSLPGEEGSRPLVEFALVVAVASAAVGIAIAAARPSALRIVPAGLAVGLAIAMLVAFLPLSGASGLVLRAILARQLLVLGAAMLFLLSLEWTLKRTERHGRSSVT